MNNIKILILEDSELDCELVKLELEQNEIEFTITRVETEKDFIRELENPVYDIVLSDYKLPQYDGMRALLEARKRVPATPFIIVTGTLSEETAADSIKNGAWDYVVKQRLFRLPNSIKNVLELKTERDDKQQAQDALVESERMYRTLMEGVSQPIFVVGYDGQIRYVNSNTADIMEKDRHDIVGQPLSGIFPGSTADTILSKIRQAIEEDNLVTDISEIPIPGGQRWFSTRINPLASKNEQPEDENTVKTALVISTDITEMKNAEKQIYQNLQEKDVLLKEVHHRVKNNMQVISSLLRMQSRFIKDEESMRMFMESQNRVRSMALIHEKLYQSDDLANINSRQYISSLMGNLAHSYRTEGKVKIKLDIQDQLLDVNLAIPVGLIVNELVSNSMKYAFNGKAGEIELLMGKEKNKYELIVKDNGIGFPEGFDPNKTDSLGMQLVTALTRQIHGTYKFFNDNGANFKITFNEVELSTLNALHKTKEKMEVKKTSQ